jgi:hypothetical protein
MRTIDLFETYAKSHFDGRDFLESPDFANKQDVRAALDEYNAAPGAAFLANIEIARRDVADTKRRLEASRLDGLFDRETYKAATVKERKTWVMCVNIVRGDFQRAVAELRHWREYAAQHIAGKLPPARMINLRELAESKSLPPSEPDRRLPPERDEEVPF